ncbi:hypothetical protein KBW71_02095 [Hydrogenophaga aromaticivorans]|uniref:hypothetical protein n=1 Tax=Hydrogenophaga aromaticivorans TaxID=2610898 RepID=UPI001B380CAD|nr:hypothetical protein [Hydrogenophaga aromaticivorans]MBQ0917222.1 hypothetical protein [Hydrogenophaga aromaticivorans]
MKVPSAVGLCLLLAFSGNAFADKFSRALKQLKGFTVIDITSVDGEFNGCESDRRVKLSNGMVLKCQGYSYTYSYSPDAVVFAKTFKYQNNSFAEIKLLIEGEVFDMGMELFKQ